MRFKHVFRPAMGIVFAVSAVCFSLVGLVEASERYVLTIKDHRFSPSELRVPSGVKIKLIVDNQDPTPEEFESHSLKREKIILGNSKATIFIGPLAPGRYDFFGEFNQDQATGVVIAE